MAPSAQPSPRAQAGMSPEQSAWVILVVAFAIFCAAVIGAGLFGWRYYTTSMIPVDGTLLRSHVNAGVVTLERGQLAPSSIERLPANHDPCPTSRDICAPIGEGTSIRTRREAGYGPVASLVLPDSSHIQLWASPTGASLTLDQFHVTQWNRSRQSVVLTQQAGYARYDIATGQAYADVDYRVQIGDGTVVELSPGGSYSIFVPSATPDPSRLPPMTDDGRQLLVEVAVRRGAATIQHGEGHVTARRSEKVQIAAGGGISAPLATTWELLADGDFSRYESEGQYHDESRTWQRYWSENAPGLTPAEKNGRFSVIRGCQPETPDMCSPEQQVWIGQLRRDGGQTRPWTIGIEQKLDADVSEYTSLRLTGWVRVLSQSVPGAGAQGSECPLMLHLTYKPTSPTDEEQPRYFCIYTATSADDQPADLEVIRYRPVPAYTWYRIDIELRDDTLIKQARYIQMLRVESRGHDYLTEVTQLSLVGRQ